MASNEQRSTGARTWLITGAAGGLGRELVTTALNAGHNVLATDLNGDALLTLNEETGARLRITALDVTDAVAARAAVRYSVRSFGRLDVLVNGAGYRSVGSIEDMPADEFRHNIETNLFGAVTMVRVALPVLRAQRSGHIVNISSIGGRRGWEPIRRRSGRWAGSPRSLPAKSNRSAFM